METSFVTCTSEEYFEHMDMIQRVYMLSAKFQKENDVKSRNLVGNSFESFEKILHYRGLLPPVSKKYRTIPGRSVPLVRVGRYTTAKYTYEQKKIDDWGAILTTIFYNNLEMFEPEDDGVILK